MEDGYMLSTTFPTLPRTTRGFSVNLGHNPTGDKLLYCNGNIVYILDLSGLEDLATYTGHTCPTTVAKVSPSGFYCASGDQRGNVRIWDFTQSEHSLKFSCRVFSGAVRDISWSHDSKRIAVVGEGRERFGHVFLFDTGSSNGNLSGQCRTVNSVDFKPTPPFSIISGSEDSTVAIFNGPPFKFKTSTRKHSSFVLVTRYNFNGSLFASAGSDGKVFLYDGTSGKYIGDLVDQKGSAHSGSVFGLSWDPDGANIATVSGDKTIKIWDAASRKLCRTITVGSDVNDQQLGIVWTKKCLVSVSLDGSLNIINHENGVIEEVRGGHNKAITQLALCQNKNIVFTADFEGYMVQWNITSGKSKNMKRIHESRVTGITHTENNEIISIGWDDTVKITRLDSAEHGNGNISELKLPSQPSGLAKIDNTSTCIISCYDHIVILKNGKLHSVEIDYCSTCVAVTSDSKYVAIGGDDYTVHIYELVDVELKEIEQLLHDDTISDVSFSADDQYLAVCDGDRKVVPYNVNKNFCKAISCNWSYHTSTVNCVRWSPDGNRLASGGVDTNIIVWDIIRPEAHPIIIRGAHPYSPINRLEWIDENRFISVGQDANIKTWIIE